MPNKPSHWDWLAAARAIRDERVHPPEPNSLSAQLADELNADAKVGGVYGGDDPLNDRTEEAMEWAERIMVAEHRERLLQQYNSSGELWLLDRLRGVLDDHLAYNPTDKPLFSHTVLGHEHEPDSGVYGGPRGIGFGTEFDLSEPVFNSGGYVAGVLAAMPMLATVYSSKYTPIDHHGWLKSDKRPLPIEAGAARGRGLHQICDWRLARGCEGRRRFVLAFPNGNWLVYFVTCSPCARELRFWI